MIPLESNPATLLAHDIRGVWTIHMCVEQRNASDCVLARTSSTDGGLQVSGVIAERNCPLFGYAIPAASNNAHLQGAS